jgi:hypothetical protein
MVLVPSDLGGAKISRQAYYKDKEFPSVISYGREFDEGTVGSTHVLDVDSEAEIGVSVRSTTLFYGSIKRLWGTKKFRAALKTQLKNEFNDSLGFVTNPQVGHPRSLKVGSSAFDLVITFRLLSLRTELHLTVFRVERVLGGLLIVGTPGKRVPLASIARLGKTMASRMLAQLLPKNTVPPAISGVAQVGQTLTADTGSWSGSPTGFSYQWQHCDEAASSCADIPGATASTYTLTDAEASTNVRVAVTARNAAGSTTAVSALTPSVAGPNNPTNTALPAISGTPPAGQTLTATTGTWSGAPTTFGFQWQRCNAAGTACVAIPGATGGSYQLGGGDVGSTIRVAVTATNLAGSTTAVSPPTSVVT